MVAAVAGVEDVLAPVRLPARVVRLVRGVADADLALQLAQVAPRLVVLQPNVRQRLVHRVALALLHLQQVGDQVDRCDDKKQNQNSRQPSVDWSHRDEPALWPLPSEEISFHGLGGYMKAAFWIWSLMSSSSLKGKVPVDPTKQVRTATILLRTK